MKSQHSFSQVPRADIPRSSFNLSFGNKTTFDADYLVPISKPIDIIPGDTFNWKTNFFIRLATPLYPIMDNMRFRTEAFFVPYRLLWDNFEKFHGAQTDPGDSIDYTIPVISSGAAAVATGSVYDYFGLPTTRPATVNGSGISCLPMRAYYKIWDDWYRDENLQDSISLATGAGPDGWSSYSLQKRNKRHDYFTSSLPWPQKGTAVSMPLGTTAPVVSEGSGIPTFTDGTSTAYLKSTNTTGNVDWNANAAATGSFAWGDTALEADLTNASAPTINDIRLAFQTQRLLERDARSGTRYVESLKAHWGVTSPDFRLQRAEFLGSGSTPINITQVAQTSGQPTPAADDKLGQLAAYGTAGGQHSWTQSFVEHGVVIVLGSVVGDITYSQGIDRYWSKSTRYDFYYPVLSQIGEQTVLSQEIYYNNDSGDDDVFGYQERYAEYRYLSSMLTGLMRPDASGTLAAWHLSEDFGSRPTLSDSFIQNNTITPLDRAIAVPSEPQFIADFFFEVKAARPLPLFGVPGNLDRL